MVNRRTTWVNNSYIHLDKSSNYTGYVCSICMLNYHEVPEGMQQMPWSNSLGQINADLGDGHATIENMSFVMASMRIPSGYVTISNECLNLHFIDFHDCY